MAYDDWLDRIVNRFPHRSVDAIKTKMSKLRGELGLPGRRGAKETAQEEYNRKAVPASRRLLEATLRVGRWS